MPKTVSEWRQWLKKATPAQRAAAEALVREDMQQHLWRPMPGPQTTAWNSQADVIGYGGAAGSGKTALACGMAVCKHKRTLMLRREATQMRGIIDEIAAILGTQKGFAGNLNLWRLDDGRQIEFGSTPAATDWTKYQGRAHDLLVFDEAANFLEVQVRALMGWVRSTDETQHCQVLMCFNPPTSDDGRWIISFFAPWIDRNHPRPAKPGELRWFAMVDGKEIECDGPEPFDHNGETITPKSRTFIPGKVQDNPFLANSGYIATLEALPEPLRSQMLKGDFYAGVSDSPWQVIPTRWVELAQARWTKPAAMPKMTSVGVDIARGGQDRTIIARRHGMWFDEPMTYPGSQTPDGPTTAGIIVTSLRDHAPIHIDVIGVGSSPYDYLKDMGLQVIGVNVAERATQTDKSGRLSFKNLRSQLWWKMREALDPANNTGIALPPSAELRADLTAANWKLSGATIQVESRDEIIEKLGKSPDFASAYVLALIDTPCLHDLQVVNRSRTVREYDPFA